MEKARREVDATITRRGRARRAGDRRPRACTPSSSKMLGRLQYRTSYGQNVLQHSIEVSAHCRPDGRRAGRRRAGRQARRPAARYRQGCRPRDGGHATSPSASNSCRKYQEKDGHHPRHPGAPQRRGAARRVVACLVQAADAISAARPGARRENLENYIKRLEKLEEITGSYPGVEKSLRHSGRPRGPRNGQARAGHPRTRWSFWPGSWPSASRTSWNTRARSRYTSCGRPRSWNTPSKYLKAAEFPALRPFFALIVHKGSPKCRNGPGISANRLHAGPNYGILSYQAVQAPEISS